MAGNNAIQFLRGTATAISSSSQVANAGQPVYDTTNRYLYVGDGSSAVNKLDAIRASTADTLKTSRTIRTNLSSTSTASFNGSSNITPGVTGTLPVSNGGTGVTSLKTLSTVSDLGYDVIADRKKPITVEGIAFWNGAYQDNISNLTYCKGGEIVDTTTAQTIGGVKTFTGDNIVKASFSRTAGAGNYKYFDYLDSGNNRMGVIGVATALNNYYGAYLQAGNEGSIGIYSNGSDVYASAPTPDANSNTNEIATTEWIRDLLSGLKITKSITILKQTTSSDVSQLGPGGTPMYPATATIDVESFVGDIAPFQFVEVTEANGVSPIGTTATISSNGKSVTLKFNAPKASTTYTLRGTCTYTVVLN